LSLMCQFAVDQQPPVGNEMKVFQVAAKASR
jgi:hypothetical protein